MHIKGTSFRFHRVFSFATAMVLLSACGGFFQGNGDSDIVYSERIDGKLAELHEKMKMIDLYVRQLQLDPSVENLQKISGLLDDLYFEYDEDDFSHEQCRDLFRERLRVDSVRNALTSILQEKVNKIPLMVVSLSDYLIDDTERHCFYASKGDTLNIDVTFATTGNVTLYNANSRQTIKSFARKIVVSDRLPIPNSAIYMLEVKPNGTQYIDAQVGLQTQTLNALIHPKRVKTVEVEASRGDWQATKVDGVKMTSLFEEPRKFTLRGQLKAAFSGNYRALVALQVPAGASDVLYSLRISTNETDTHSDGRFNENMSHSYHKVRFFGLPLYESSRSSGLLATLLGENVPVREEDAYINMYVFFDAGQARKFQDGELTSNIKYNVDYSTMGTQSCTGRIPAKGHKTIYLGFENERMRYNNYVWLEAISAVPHTEYFKMQYTIVDGDEECDNECEEDEE